MGDLGNRGGGTSPTGHEGRGRIMPRKLRVQFEGAIYHVMPRGNAHLFQGRYRAEMIEDESYYWVVSRYIHLNPVRAGLVDRPEQWEWSSYPGYARRSRQLPWVAHAALLGAWQGEWGGSDAAAAYRRYVES